MIDSFGDIDSVWSFDSAEYVDNADANPTPPTFNPHSIIPLNSHPTTTVSVLSHTSLLPASRGY